MRCATLILLTGAGLFAQNASIEGTAVSAVTGLPLPGVHVRLLTGIFEGGVKEVYGAISDKTGHFSITGMPPGAYILAPECNGYLYVQPKGENSPVPALQIKPGQQLQNYKLEMTPRAALAGRVIDEYGDPVPNVTVQAMPVSPGNQSINLFGNLYMGTNDRGEFRVVTQPGKFYLKAQPNNYSNDLPEIRTDGTSEAVYAATFYPSAASQDRASAIEAAAGSDVTGLDIRLVRVRSLSISGIVSGIPDSQGRAMILLRYGENAQQLNSSRSATADQSGKFQIGRLSPGFYRLTAQYSSGSHTLQSGPVDLKLDSGDETGVELSLNSGAEVTGTLQVTGLPEGKRTVRLKPADMMLFMSQTLTGAVDADGGFKIPSVPAGKYTVAVDPPSDGAYVKSVQLDGAAAPGGVLDLSRGARGARIKVVLSGGAAQITGKVLDKDGNPISNSLTMVFLMTDPKIISEDVMSRVTSSDGVYTKKGICPGKYRLFAVDLFHYVGKQASQDNDLTELFQRGEEIEIKEGDKLVKDLKVIEKEDTNAGKK